MQSQPNNTDAVLGNNSSISTAAVLGGIDKVKQQLSSNNSFQVQQGLIDAVQYGNKGKALITKMLAHPDHVKFFIDGVTAGFSPTLGEARLSWQSPTIVTNNQLDLQRLIRKTEVDVVWDNCGKEGHVIYPAAYRKDILRSLWEIAANPAHPEHRSLGMAIHICSVQPDPICTLARNLKTQLENFEP